MKLLKSILAISFISVALIGFSNPPNGDGPTGGQDPDNDTPIDGGIALLLVAGAGFGAKKLFKKK